MGFQHESGFDSVAVCVIQQLGSGAERINPLRYNFGFKDWITTC